MYSMLPHECRFTVRYDGIVVLQIMPIQGLERQKVIRVVGRQWWAVP